MRVSPAHKLQINTKCDKRCSKHRAHTDLVLQWICVSIKISDIGLCSSIYQQGLSKGSRICRPRGITEMLTDSVLIMCLSIVAGLLYLWGQSVGTVVHHFAARLMLCHHALTVIVRHIPATSRHSLDLHGSTCITMK